MKNVTHVGRRELPGPEDAERKHRVLLAGLHHHERHQGHDADRDPIGHDRSMRP